MSVGERIRLEHGSGGALSRELVEEVIYPRFRGSGYPDLLDATEVAGVSRPVLTTDSFVVDPLFFPGGDIGKLAVYGSCNDLAVSGARPIALTLGAILEEGFAVRDLEAVLDSIVEACIAAEVSVVTGDTKVVPRGTGGGLYLNSAGLGTRITTVSLDASRIVAGDRCLVSGPMGAHGIAVLAAREGLPVGSAISSDCANLFPATRVLCDLGEDLRVMRDATRGGVSAVLNELVGSLDSGALLSEDAIPVDPDVSAVADTLGLNPLEIANEGLFVAVVSDTVAERAVALLGESGFPEAAIIGAMVADYPGRVVLETRIGGRRMVDTPRGLLLPRIC